MVKITTGKAPAPGPSFSSGDEYSSLSRRVKMIEERYTNIRSKFQIMEQNILHKNKTLLSELKSINMEITESRKEINELKDKMISLLKELDGFARKEHVELLKKYIAMWEPVNFVTKNDVEDIVRRMIEQS